MEILDHSEAVEKLNSIIEFLSIDENLYYVCLDIAHQLKDELRNINIQDTEQ